MQNKGSIFWIFLFLIGIASINAQYTEADWEERDTWMDVNRIFKLTGLQAGDKVADIGCHEGYLSMHLARNVGEEGAVFSVDVRESRLRTLEGNARKRNLKNITTILGDYDNPKLPANSLDVVFVVDTYHEMDDYMTILGHIKKALKPGGRILILEKLKDHIMGKSRSQQTSAHSLSPKYVRKELKEAGFILTEEIRDMGPWENEEEKRIWVLVAQLPST